MSEDWERSVREHIQQVKDLKPCPFCGADYIHLTVEEDELGDLFVYCNACDMTVRHAYPGLSKDELTAHWNRRVKE